MTKMREKVSAAIEVTLEKAGRTFSSFNPCRRQETVSMPKYKSFSHDVTAVILVFQNNETEAMLVYQENPLEV